MLRARRIASIRDPQSAICNRDGVLMRLERLEINGFKSFSDRSELAFDKGVTAIVGPNGCGKSNVADAITWVMGEQSAKSLRGEKMEDVIFNGSDARKPTAAAEVRLRFSGLLKTVSGPAFPRRARRNGHDTRATATATAMVMATATAMATARPRQRPCRRSASASSLPGDDIEAIIQSVAREVEVTRRLYRSGESEYLIDGQICRLRDVHDLLMDTGLGAKAYAIIEQGKIGLILSSRPTDRRQLIEEAAGVTKYKARRRSAELKLEAAQQNLTRIDDIVFEVEKQRGTLKRQAGKARRYQKLRDELRRWEKVLFARKYRQLAETIESARARLADARERESLAAARVGRGRVAISGACGSSWSRPSRRATASREAAHARELAINRQQQQIAFDREQVAGARRRGRRRSRRSSTRSTRGASRRARLLAGAARRPRPTRTPSATARRRRWRPNRRPTRRRIARSKGSRPTSKRRAARCFRRSIPRPRCATRSSTRRRRAIASPRRCRSSTSRSTTCGSSPSARRRIAPRRPTACAARTRRSRRRASPGRRANRSWPARASSTNGAPARCARASTSSPASKRGSSRSRSSTRRAPATATPRAPCSSQANGNGQPAGRDRRLPRGRGGYERAVEACLGDLLQHVVVERPEHAAAGFQLVREAGAGRCGFLVTSAVEAPAVSRRLLRADERHRRRRPGSQSGARRSRPGRNRPRARRASSRCRRSSASTARSPDAIRQAIGDAWIAQSYDGAAAASRLTPLPVATLDGDVFRGPHLVSGGGSRRSARHPGDEARNQGAARADRRRPRGAVPARAGDRGARGHDRPRLERDRRAERRAPQAGKGGRRPRRAAAARHRRGSASGAEGGAARPRESPGGRGARHARPPPGRSARVDRAAGRRAARGRRAADRRAAPSVRGARGRRRSEPPRRRSRRRACRARRARGRPGVRSPAAARRRRWSSSSDRRRSPRSSKTRGAASTSCARRSPPAKRSSTPTSASSTRCVRS